MQTKLKKNVAPSFTSTIDGVIVKGFLANQKAAIKKLKGMGFSRKAIINRAKELGLTDQFIKRCSVGNPDVALRTCLRCGERFLSLGFQNRLCPRCKNLNW
jgi:hypothetical protein